MSKSKFINLRYDGENTLEAGKQVIEKQYINRLNSDAYVDVYNPGDLFTTDFDVNYPKANIMEYRSNQVRTTTFLDGSDYKAGLTIDLASGFGDWNSLVIQFPKLNKIFLQEMINSDVIIELEDKATGNVTYEITYNSNITTETLNYTADFYGAGEDLYQVSTGKISIRNGLILLDEDITRYFDKQSFAEADYTINIYMNKGTDFNYFAVSNITFNNHYVVCLDADYEAAEINLSKITKGKNTGVVFRKINETDKMFKGTIDLWGTENKVELDTIIRNFNLNTPVFMFPMCEVNEITEFNEALTNYEIGGLFNFKPSKKYKSDTYDIYETDVDLSEHK